MATSESRQSVSRPSLSKVRAAVVTLVVSFLVIAITLTVTIFGSHHLARQAGMPQQSYLCDMIVVSASIIVQLTLERFLRPVARAAWCLDAYLLYLIGQLFKKH